MSLGLIVVWGLAIGLQESSLNLGFNDVGFLTGKANPKLRLKEDSLYNHLEIPNVL